MLLRTWFPVRREIYASDPLNSKPTKRTTIWTLTLTNSRSVSCQSSWTLMETTGTKESQLNLCEVLCISYVIAYVFPMRCISTLSAIFQTSCNCANITWSFYQITWRHMTFFKKCKCCAFKTHQRCTIITCDTSQFLRHIRCEIHSVFIDEVWYAQENTWDLTHTQTQIHAQGRHNCSLLNIISDKVH